ncbi:hypothetical protein MJH12_04685 [bacterium]|nr:hypothetical protein [bacterium]
MKLLIIQLLAISTIFCQDLSIQSQWTDLLQKKSYHQAQSFYQDLYSPMAFVSHINPKSYYGTYLIHNVSLPSLQKLKNSIEIIKDLKLKSRGEAHITVLTPPEFNQIKKSHPNFSMEKVHDLIKDRMQSLKWRSLGIGHQKGKNYKGIYSEVFFLVIESKDLRELRYEIKETFQLSDQSFNPDLQDFHITIGYTLSDLHNIDKGIGTLDYEVSMIKVLQNGLVQ